MFRMKFRTNLEQLREKGKASKEFRLNLDNHQACSAVVIALRLVPKVLGSNQDFSTKHVTCLFTVVE